ncbi:hypothetical protein CASFOL_032356 [Castilleja foliolosa]|uniref:Uncharacterized protein n=1 Tax=Castilleja foliolosa TaxID=1961234 RepID=A0ABD3C183_9LAMI
MDCNVPPLSDEEVVESAADLMGELFLFGVCSYRKSSPMRLIRQPLHHLKVEHYSLHEGLSSQV